MINRKLLCGLVAGLAISIGGCVANSSIDKRGDLTGDGIEDVMTSEGYYRTLHVGDEKGGYDDFREKDIEESDVKYFKNKDNEIYFFDGEVYRQAFSDE